MSPELFNAVQTSFERIQPNLDEMSAVFFQKIFRQVPKLRDQLPDTADARAQMFSDLLGYGVRNLHRRGGLQAQISQIARRNKWDSTMLRHVAPIGAAFAYTLRERTPNGISPKELAGWMEAFSLISDISIKQMLDMAA